MANLSGFFFLFFRNIRDLDKRLRSLDSLESPRRMFCFMIKMKLSNFFLILNLYFLSSSKASLLTFSWDFGSPFKVRSTSLCFSQSFYSNDYIRLFIDVGYNSFFAISSERLFEIINLS